MKFSEIQIPGIRDHPRAGNFAGNPNLITRTSQNHEKLRNLENMKNTRKPQDSSIFGPSK